MLWELNCTTHQIPSNGGISNQTNGSLVGIIEVSSGTWVCYTNFKPSHALLSSKLHLLSFESGPFLLTTQTSPKPMPPAEQTYRPSRALWEKTILHAQAQEYPRSFLNYRSLVYLHIENFDSGKLRSSQRICTLSTFIHYPYFYPTIQATASWFLKNTHFGNPLTDLDCTPMSNSKSNTI